MPTGETHLYPPAMEAERVKTDCRSEVLQRRASTGHVLVCPPPVEVKRPKAVCLMVEVMRMAETATYRFFPGRWARRGKKRLARGESGAEDSDG